MPGQLDRFVLCGAVAAAFALGGCAGGSSAIAPSASQAASDVAAPQSATSVALAPRVFAHAASFAARPSGSCPKASIFVGDFAANTVDIFPLAGKNQPMCGQVSGSFNGLQGLASDRKGHLYVANTNDTQVLEFSGPYPPGSLVHTYPDSTGYPSDVAVSKSDLVAIMNICSVPSCGQGSVIFYKQGATTPCATVAVSFRPYFGGFDAAGNLYVDFETSSASAGLAEISGGCSATSAQNLNIPSGIFPGGVAVDTAGLVDVVDQIGSDIEAFAPPDFSKPKFTVPLTSSDPVTLAFEKSGKRFWGTGAGNGSIGEFLYPTGGNPINMLAGVSEGIGIAVIPAEMPG